MSQIRDWKRKKVESKGQLPIDSLSEKDVRHLVERLLLQNPDMLPRALKVTSLAVTDDLALPGEGDLDPAQTLVYTPAGYSQAVIRYLEDEHQAPPDFTDHEALTPDGNTPNPVLEIEAIGGKAFIHLKWTPVAHPHKFQYDVHISASASFTHSDLTKVTTTSGDQVWIRALADGTPLQFGTTYYMKVVSWDADGEAAPSPEASAALDANATGDITAGSITAHQLEAMLVMSTTMIAGNHPPGARIEFGVTEHDGTEMVGLHAFDSEDMLTFMIDANTGMVSLYGTVYFGLGSQLMTNDIIKLLAQPTGFQIPTLVQSAGNKILGATSATCSWPAATTTGNALFMVLSLDDADGTAPTPTAPSGWTTVTSIASGRQSLVLYRVNAGTSRSGAENITLGDTCSGTLQLLEYSGVTIGAADEVASSSATSSSFSVGPTATTDTAVELCLSIMTNVDTTAAFFADTSLASVTDDFEFVRYQAYPILSPQFFRYQATAVYHKVTASTGTVDMAGTLSRSDPWLGVLATFRAKVAGPETPDANKLHMYVEDVDGSGTLHTIGENAAPHSVVLGPPNQEYELKYFETNFNPPNTGAHTGGSSNLSVSGVLVGDIVVGIHHAEPGNRGITFSYEPKVTVDDLINVWWFNADTVALDLPSLLFGVTILRRRQ